MKDSVYNKTPINNFEDIDIYVQQNDYIENYEKISHDHLTILAKEGVNPFMDEQDWHLLELTTKKLILKYYKTGKILDVGVGTGRLLDTLPNTFEKYGVDISLEYLKISKAKNISVCKAMLEDLPYKDETFDILVSTDVLEHVLDLNKCISEMFRVLKINGHLIIRVPYKENLKAYLDPSIPYELVHLRNFDEFTLKLLFEKIFKSKVLEYETTLPYLNRYIIKNELKNPIKLIFTLFSYSFRFLNRKIYYFLGNYFLNHSEINIVIKKIK